MDIETRHLAYTHVALEVDDSQADVEQLNDLGITINLRPVSISFPTGTSKFIYDPDRNVYEFQ